MADMPLNALGEVSLHGEPEGTPAAAWIGQFHLVLAIRVHLTDCGAANLGCSRLSAGFPGVQILSDGPEQSRLKGGCGQDCPPHNQCRILIAGKCSPGSIAASLGRFIVAGEGEAEHG